MFVKDAIDGEDIKKEGGRAIILMKNILNLKDIFGNPTDIPEDVEKQCSNDTKRGKKS